MEKKVKFVVNFHNEIIIETIRPAIEKVMDYLTLDYERQVVLVKDSTEPRLKVLIPKDKVCGITYQKKDIDYMLSLLRKHVKSLSLIHI